MIRTIEDLWSFGIGEGGLPNRPPSGYQPYFYLHLEDPHTHWEMIEGLESRFKVEECSFDTVYGTLDGYEIWTGRVITTLRDSQDLML